MFKIKHKIRTIVIECDMRNALNVKTGDYISLDTADAVTDMVSGVSVCSCQVSNSAHNRRDRKRFAFYLRFVYLTYCSLRLR